MRSIAVINQKGGCGKTTVAINLAACLAVQGRRTLLVDMDPQSHCAVGLAVPEEQIEQTVYDLLISAYNGSELGLKSIVWQIAQNFDMAPAGVELAAFEQQLAGKEGREDLLKNVLASEAGSYNYVIIDCPPSIGLLTFNALRAADEVMIPVETGYFALHGLAKQLETLNVLKEQARQNIVVRALASMYDVRTKLAREVLSELRKHHGEILFEQVINFNTKLKEAASFGQPITEYDPASKGMRDFMQLARAVTEGRSSTTDRAAQQVETVDSQLAAVSKSAIELLARSERLVGAAPAAARKESATVQERIDNFYGVRGKQGKVQFVTMYPKAQKVCLAGDFNDWQPDHTPMKRADEAGRWVTELPLSSGRYRYRLVVDGRWQQDPYNNAIESNEFGEYNSIVEVK